MEDTAADTIPSETKHKTLEEIAAAFGDKVVTLTEADLATEQTVFDEKVGVGHVEVKDMADRRV